MRHQRRRPDNLFMVIVVSLVVLGMLLSSVGMVAAAADNDGGPKVWLSSRFLLWDTGEKMVDSNFTIIMTYQNESQNDTAFYEVMVDNLHYNGTFQDFETLAVDLENVSVIKHLEVWVNNESALLGLDVVVRRGMTSQYIYDPTDPWVISLNPLEWKNKEWNIFFAVMASALVGCLIAYRLVVKYRRYSGVKVIE